MKPSLIPIIIQATNHYNKEFQCKVLEKITEEETVLSYMVGKIRRCFECEIVLSVSNQSCDDPLEYEATQLGIKCYRGELLNLVSRLMGSANLVRCQRFVRVMGNCPLFDSESLARLVNEHRQNGAEFSYNEHKDGVPWGMGAEVIELGVLERLSEMPLNVDQKEMPMLYIRQDTDTFKLHLSKSPIVDHQIKLVLDTKKDLMLIRDLIFHLERIDISSVVKYLNAHPLLALSNTESPPKEVGLEKLFLHSEKFNSIKFSTKDTIDLSYPVSVELSLTNKCNLGCVWCSDFMLRKRQGRSEELDLVVLYQLFDDLKQGGTKGVVIEGGGEPTIYHHFEAVVKRLVEIGLPCGLITNGTVEISPELLSSFEWIRVSLDASTKSEFNQLKKSDIFDNILSNIYDYAKLCPTVGVGYVVTNKNVSQLETLVLRLRQYGVSYVQFRPVVDCPELFPEEIDLTYLKRYERADFSILIDGMMENSERGNHGLPCRVHSITTVIGADGSVHLCGRMNVYDWMTPIGNLLERSFKEIWKSDERKRQAAMVMDHHFCRQYCPQCRLSKFNALFERLGNIRTPHFI